MSKTVFNNVEEELRKLEELSKDQARKIKELEQYTQSAPDIIARQKNTIPPLEVVTRKKQEHKIKVSLATSNNVYNLKRELKSNAVLLFLLIIAITFSTVWALKILNQI